MFGWLRRHQPRGILLAVLYWILLTLAAFTILFLFFYYVVDRILPAMY